MVILYDVTHSLFPRKCLSQGVEFETYVFYHKKQKISSLCKSNLASVTNIACTAI